ncbi:c-type cytochrome [Pseudacidobacterium ailaaui]|jgi:mono/diheme cytochrome c family protein|uniref:c-type cytochrome n=1 Tax=Pseudacidobacterium ailaaui TaxID=1382359 RepID=UPI00047BD9D1|nr:c-type cytochrome [Pseudacidobacterium ailaaui]
MSRSAGGILLALCVGLCAAGAWAAGEKEWPQRVPEKDRQRVNPLRGQADAAVAGAKLYAQHCAKCHGENLEGNGSRPSLRSETVQQATDGELFWMLKNGDLLHGMPSWSSLPEPARWQIIAFLKDANSSGKTK